jgi:hypothetical protein
MLLAFCELLRSATTATMSDTKPVAAEIQAAISAPDMAFLS